MSSSFAIRTVGLSKCYHIYARPQDRLKQMIIPRCAALIGRTRPRYYDEFWALQDVNLEIPVGETFGILGRNGSGKSTLLQLVAGTLTPTRGTVKTNGRVAAILELGSGFNPEFTGRENVFLSAGIYGLSREQVQSRYDQIAAFADIGTFIDQPVKTYSSGMTVRLAFAVIAHVDADILIVDEALAVGDAFFTQKCMRFLREFKARGTIFFVSHDTQAIQSLCDRAALVEKGRVRMVDDARAVTEAYLEDLYGQTQIVAPSREEPAIEMPSHHAEEKLSSLISTSNVPDGPPVPPFNMSQPGFGAGGARICRAALLDDRGHNIQLVSGGEYVTLLITVEIFSELRRPVVGFYLKDRLGQYLFGDNTFLTYLRAPPTVRPGEILEARFDFRMPILPAGDYFIAPAVADGTQDNHVQHHWLHEALLIRSTAAGLVHGLVGIPMSHVGLTVRHLEEVR